MRLVRQSEFARITGKSRAWICTLVKQGKISVDGNGLIDVEMALLELEGSKDYNRDPQRAWSEIQRNKNKEKHFETDEEYIPKYGNVACNDTDVGKETQRSKLVRETFEAKLQELKYLKEKGELILVQDVKKINSRIATSVRSSLLTLPTKMSAQLEGMTVVEIQRTLENIINDILIEINSLGNIEINV